MTNHADREPTRETIAFGREIDWEREARYGTVSFGPDKASQFPPLPVGTVQTLLERGDVDPEYRHNDAPPAARLVEWASDVQQRFKREQFDVGLVGYLVSPERADSRFALTGVSIRSPGPIPDALKGEVAREFTPDLLSVDDFEIRLEWD